MASKRMFSEKILESDAFIDMQLQSQILYVHLCMAADDDGFIGSPNRVTRMIGAEKKHYEELLNKRFILSFPSGVCVIKHWLINNTIKKDRYVETVYREEKEIILIKDNSAYTERNKNGNKMDPIMETKRKQNGSEIVPQVRLGKNSIDKGSIDKSNNTAEIEDFFESVWKLYPLKQGKGSISNKQKKILYDLGYDVVKKCIERYLATNPKEGFMKHGSTFFNSGYVDFLDDNSENNSCDTAQKVVVSKYAEQEAKTKGYIDRSIKVYDGGWQ
jgi:hypothetical protein